MSLAAAFGVSLLAGVIVNGFNDFEQREAYKQIIRKAARDTIEEHQKQTSLDSETVLEIIEKTPIGPSVTNDLENVGEREDLIIWLGGVFAENGDMDRDEAVGFVRTLVTKVEQQIASEAGPGFSIILQYVQDIAKNTQKQTQQLQALGGELTQTRVEGLSETWDSDLRTLDTRTRKTLDDSPDFRESTQAKPLRSKEIDEANNIIDSGGNVLLRGQAGAGKTTIARTLLRDWRESDRGAAYLIDARELNLNTSLRESVNISHSLIEIFETAAEELGHVLVVIDQLDSIYNKPVISEVEDFLYEAVDTPGLAVVCASRDWELERGDLLTHVRDKFREIRLDNLSEADVANYLSAIGIPKSEQPPDLTEFVTTPLRFQILLSLIEEAGSEGDPMDALTDITSDLQLWNHYYNSLEEHEPPTTEASEAAVTECAGSLAEIASLSGPELSLANSDAPADCPNWAIDRLQSRGVIRQHSSREKQALFVHEELQAYLYARRLVDRGNELNLIAAESDGTLSTTDVFEWVVQLLADQGSDPLISFLQRALAVDSGLSYYPANVVLSAVRKSVTEPDDELARVVWQWLEDRETLSASFFASIEDDAWLQSYLHHPYSRDFTNDECEAVSTSLTDSSTLPTEWLAGASDSFSLSTLTYLTARVSTVSAPDLRGEIIHATDEAELFEIPHHSVWQLFDHLIEEGHDDFALELAETLFNKFNPSAFPRQVSLDDGDQYLLDRHIWEGTGRTFRTLYERKPEQTRGLFESCLENLEMIAEERNQAIPIGTQGSGTTGAFNSPTHAEAFEIRRLPSLIESHLWYFLLTVTSEADEVWTDRLSESQVETYLDKGSAFREFGRAIIAKSPETYTNLLARELTATDSYGPNIRSNTTLRLLESGFGLLDEATMKSVAEIIDSVPCKSELETVIERLTNSSDLDTIEQYEIEQYWKTTYFATVYETARTHIDHQLLQLVEEYDPPAYLEPVPTREPRRDLPRDLPEGSAVAVVQQCNQWATIPSREGWAEWEQQQSPNPLFYIRSDFGDRVRNNPDEYLPELLQVRVEAKVLVSQGLRDIVTEIHQESRTDLLSDLIDAVEYCYDLGTSGEDPRDGVEQRRVAMRCALDMIRYEPPAKRALEQYPERIRNLAMQGLRDPDPGLEIPDDTFILKGPRLIPKERVRSLSFLILAQLVQTGNLEPEEIEDVLKGVSSDTSTPVLCAIGTQLSLVAAIDKDLGTTYLESCLNAAEDDEWLIWTAYVTGWDISPQVVQEYKPRLTDAMATLGKHAQAEQGSLGPTHELLSSSTPREAFSFLIELYTSSIEGVDQVEIIKAYLSHADDRIIGDQKAGIWEDSDELQDWWRFRLDCDKLDHPGPHELGMYLNHLNDSAEEARLPVWSDLIERSIPKAVTTREGWSAVVEYLNSQAERYPRQVANLLKQAVVNRPLSEFTLLSGTFEELEERLLQNESSADVMEEIMKRIAPVNDDVEQRLQERA